MQHSVTVEEIRRVVRVRRIHPVYGTQYVLRCSCGWTCGPCDYIDAMRLGRSHEGVKRG